jgi:hypothetical protein
VAVNSVVDDASVSSAGRSARLADELTERRAGLVALAEGIGRSRSRLDEIAERSYWHPNGFMKLLLEERAGWGQLRLHVWPDPVHDDDVHDHGWQYESVVIDGDVREVRYREVAGDAPGVPMWRHSYSRIGHHRFALSDPVRVTVAVDPVPLDLRAGDRSGGGPRHVHRFFAVTAPTVTMLRVGPSIETYSHVYRTEAAPDPVVAPRPTSRADVAEWVDHVRTVTST